MVTHICNLEFGRPRKRISERGLGRELAFYYPEQEGQMGLLTQQ